MDLGIRDRVAVVTGGDSGIGPKAAQFLLAVLSGRTYTSCRQAEQPVGGGLNLFLGDPGT